MVILSETSQCGGNMAPNLSSHCKRCFLNQVYRRSILSSHPLSSESLNRKRYSFSCTPTNHFKSSCLKNLKSWKYLDKNYCHNNNWFLQNNTQNLNLSKLQVHVQELASLLIHPNLDWFSKKVDRMAHFLNYLKLDFLSLIEHRLSETNPYIITNIKGYKLFWKVNKLWKCQ